MNLPTGKFGEAPVTLFGRVARALSETPMGFEATDGDPTMRDILRAGFLAYGMEPTHCDGYAETLLCFAAEQALLEMSLPSPDMVVVGAALLEHSDHLASTQGATMVWQGMSETALEPIWRLRRDAMARRRAARRALAAPEPTSPA